MATSSGGIIIPSVAETEQKSTLLKSRSENLLASKKTSLEDTKLSSSSINYELSKENIDKDYCFSEMKNISPSSFLKGFFNLKRESDRLFKSLKEIKDNKSNLKDLTHSQKINISLLGSNFLNNILRDYFF